MPLFLTAPQLYRILQRESPEGVQLDGPPTAGFVTADNYSFAECLETAYQSASGIYLNYFPGTAVDFIDDWEIMCFNQITASPISLAQRRANVIAKLRNRPGGINYQSMVNAVQGLFPWLPLHAPSGFDLINWQSASGVWQIGVSLLGVNTFLGGYYQLRAVGAGLCAGCTNPGQFGLTQAQWTEMQDDAYTYEVRIYDIKLTAEQRLALDIVLTAAEPARSTHVITDGLADSLIL